MSNGDLWNRCANGAELIESLPCLVEAVGLILNFSLNDDWQF